MKKAFTLIELLVVIAIVGLIGAVMLPVLGRTREAGRRAQCANNLRQHGIAWYLYLDDHNERFPAYRHPPSEVRATQFTFGGWKGAAYPDTCRAERRPLNPYLEIEYDSSPNIELFHCLSDTKPAPHGASPPMTYFDYYGTSYCCNFILLMYIPAGVYRPRPLSTITSPRNKVYLETCEPHVRPGHGGHGFRDNPRVPVMVLFVDGHVGLFLFSNDFELIDPETDKAVLWDPSGPAD